MNRSILLLGSILLLLGVVALWRALGPAAEALPEPENLTDTEKNRLKEFWRVYHEATASRIAGDYLGATELYQRALETDPNHEDSLYYLGSCYLQLGEYSRASEIYRRITEINPSSNRAFAQLGSVLSTPQPGHPLQLDAADRALQRCVELYPEESGAFVRLGLVALASGRRDDARVYFDQAAGFGSPEAIVWSGFVRLRQGDTDGATTRFERVLDIAERERQISRRGMVSEGDVRAKTEASGSAEAAPLRSKRSSLESAVLRARAFLKWTRIDDTGSTTEPSAAGPGQTGGATRNIAATLPLKPHDRGRGAWADFDRDGDIDLAITTPGVGLSLYRWIDETLDPVDLSEAGSFVDSSDLAWGDFDGDNLPDLYLVKSASLGPGRNHLLRNRSSSHSSSARFHDVTESSGLGGSRTTNRAHFSDLDLDGRMDLVEVGPNRHGAPALRLFFNQGKGTFLEGSSEAGIELDGQAVDVAIDDYDSDGSPDLLVLRWMHPLALYRNLGERHFVDVTAQAGLAGVGGAGLSVLSVDYDRDGHRDLLVTRRADYEEVLAELLGSEPIGGSLRLFRNQGDLSFREVTESMGLSHSYGIMQAVGGDIDADGWPDLVLANGGLEAHRLEPSVVLRNQNGRSFMPAIILPATGLPSNSQGSAFVQNPDGSRLLYMSGQGVFRFH